MGIERGSYRAPAAADCSPATIELTAPSKGGRLAGTMKVFITWSGERSRAVAVVVAEWLPCVIQAVDPWISSTGVDRGAQWFPKILEELAETKLGIVCLTRENQNAPWIHFEAGALAKGKMDSRVCTLLIDLKATDVNDGPLVPFNHTLPNKEGMLALVRTANSCLEGRHLTDKVLESAFEAHWQKLHAGFVAAVDRQPEQEPPPRTQEDLLREVLDTVRRVDRKVAGIGDKIAPSNMWSDLAKKQAHHMLSNPSLYAEATERDEDLEGFPQNLQRMAEMWAEFVGRQPRTPDTPEK